MEAFFSLNAVSKSFGKLTAVDQVNLELRKGEVFSLLGPSGCGKTTLLRILGGFLQPDQGRLILQGKDITEQSPEKRAINTVFQSYALFPHLSLWDNIAFGLKVAKRPRREIQSEVERMLELIDMKEHARKKPSQISGGQKQRVAIARALVNKPSILLLDEPLAALDLKLRQRMLLELDRIHDEVGITFIYVTHDQGEAMSLSDRVAVMNEGRIEQVGTPAEIYEAPHTSFVAAFIGDTNFLVGKVIAQVEGDYCTVDVDGLGNFIIYNDKKLKAGDEVNLSLRPEKCTLMRQKPAHKDLRNAVKGVVEKIIYMGSHTKFWVRSGDYLIAAQQQHGRFLLDEKPITWDEEVWLCWHADDGYMLQRYEEKDEAMLSAPGYEEDASEP